MHILSLRLWALLSATWLLIVAIALDPFEAVSAMAATERVTARAAAPPPPGPSDFYAPPDLTRGWAIDRQSRQAADWLADRRAAQLRGFLLVAGAPPIAGLFGIYAGGLLSDRRRARAADRRRIVHAEWLRP